MVVLAGIVKPSCVRLGDDVFEGYCFAKYYLERWGQSKRNKGHGILLTQKKWVESLALLHDAVELDQFDEALFVDRPVRRHCHLHFPPKRLDILRHSAQFED